MARSRFRARAANCSTGRRCAPPILKAAGARPALRQAARRRLGFQNNGGKFMTLRHLARAALVGAAVVLTLCSGALAQSGTLKFVVGLAPGGAVDPYARISADEMAKI